MAIHIDDNFLDELGLRNASEEQKASLMTQILETMELRVGTRLAEEATDEQLDEFDRLAPKEDDSAEVLEQKQQEMAEWLKQNYPNYEAVIAEELQRLKDELASSLNSIFDSNAS